MGPNRFTALITAIVLSAPQPAAAQEPTLGLVLERAAGYVAEFHRRLSSIVAGEQYVQDWKLPTRAELRGARDLSHRELRSDLLLVKPGVGMRERYDNKRAHTIVEGRATYGRFRQFQVNVDETFAPLKK